MVWLGPLTPFRVQRSGNSHPESHSRPPLPDGLTYYSRYCNRYWYYSSHSCIFPAAPTAQVSALLSIAHRVQHSRGCSRLLLVAYTRLSRQKGFPTVPCRCYNIMSASASMSDIWMPKRRTELSFRISSPE